MSQYRLFLSLIVLFTFSLNTEAQSNKVTKLLFVGNSYTGANNLSQLVQDLSNSAGDSVLFATFSAGGQRLEEHANFGSQTMMEIASGNYDFVILQEQSQIPSFPQNDVKRYFYPAVRILDSAIKSANSCSKTVLYMTWGRKNGDDQNCQTWPPVCTYKGMDSLINFSYTTAANANKTLISPVGAAWNYVINHYPNIELYEGDGSHPNPAGTYLAACCFYSIIFQKDPMNIKFNFSLDSNLADTFKMVAQKVVFNNLSNWGIQNYITKANFNYNLITDTSVQFSNTSVYADSFQWDFGDQTYSSEHQPLHAYAEKGKYNVKLIAFKCSKSDTISMQVNTHPSDISTIQSNGLLSILPNPFNNSFEIHSELDIKSTKLFNLQGQELTYSSEGHSKSVKIHSAAIESGIYWLAIEFSNGETGYYKIVSLQ